MGIWGSVTVSCVSALLSAKDAFPETRRTTVREVDQGVDPGINQIAMLPTVGSGLSSAMQREREFITGWPEVAGVRPSASEVLEGLLARSDMTTWKTPHTSSMEAFGVQTKEGGVQYV